MKKNQINPGNRSPKRFLRSALGLAIGCFILASCSSTASDNTAQNNQPTSAAPTESAQPAEAPAADDSKGIGPVATVDLGAAVDEALAGKGKATFDSKCAACHKFGERYVGPDLAGVTERRKPEWILNMILNPQEMTQKNPVAQELLSQFMTQMPNQNLSQEEARAVLEYFRTQAKS